VGILFWKGCVSLSIAMAWGAQGARPQELFKLFINLFSRLSLFALATAWAFCPAEEVFVAN